MQNSIRLALMPKLNEVVRAEVAIRDPDGNLLDLSWNRTSAGGEIRPGAN
jgi:hypothetical protein